MVEGFIGRRMGPRSVLGRPALRAEVLLRPDRPTDRPRAPGPLPAPDALYERRGRRTEVQGRTMRRLSLCVPNRWHHHLEAVGCSGARERHFHFERALLGGGTIGVARSVAEAARSASHKSFTVAAKCSMI
jgi:hypothetical protein